MIGKMKITPKLLPRTGDRDDYVVEVEGPEPSTPIMKVPFSFTGSILAVWGVPSEKAAEELARTIFGGTSAVIGSRGTASGFPPQGYWFDSYNSESTLEETINKLLNEGDFSFEKNRSTSGIYGLLVGQETGDLIERIDRFFNKKFEMDFFKNLDEVFALSEIADTVTKPPTDKANFMYKICLLSCIIDAVYVRLPDEKGLFCAECNRVVIGSIEALRNWLKNKLDSDKAKDLTITFKMIKKLRNQFPVHNHYELKGGMRSADKNVSEAEAYFKFGSVADYPDQWHRVLVKFNNALLGYA